MGIATEIYRRWTVFRHRPRHWVLRSGTIDRRVFLHVVVDNEYRLPARFAPTDVILDVGGHIGSFSYAALRRGAGMVYCCEPHAPNLSILRQNLQPYQPRVHIVPNAVWRSDVPATQLNFHNPGDARNTGEGRVSVAAAAESVATVPFDELVGRATARGQRVRLLKMDCEGAEWPILLTSQRLHLIDEICGEYHLDADPAAFSVPDGNTFSRELLHERLGRAGFAVETLPMEPRPDLWGWFFAKRAA